MEEEDILAAEISIERTLSMAAAVAEAQTGTVNSGEEFSLPSNGRALINGLSELREVLARQFVAFPRDPTARLIEENVTIPPELQARVGRTLAFGQYISHPSTGNQIGLYGTAAALEIMATSSAATRLLAGTSLDSFDREWASCFLKTWNYFDLIASAHFDSRVLIDQSSSTLRICHMLRAAAAARPVLLKLASAFRDEINRDLVCDLRFDTVPDPAKRVGKMLFEKLVGARVVEREIRMFRTQSDSGATSFRYGTTSPQTPRNTRDWLFMWGSVLMAVQRSLRAGIVDENEIERIVKTNDLLQIKIAIEDKERCDDARFRAFAIWALDHLQRESPDQSELSEVSHFRMWSQSDSVKKWTHANVCSICTELLKTGTWMDLSTPYTRSVTGTPGSFLDYFILPAFPVLIELLARHQPRKLFIRRVSRNLQESVRRCDKPLADGSIPALPFQPSRWNGSVNCLYFREAAGAASRALAQKRAWPIWLANWGWGRISGQSQTTLILSAFILMNGLSFYVLFAKSPSTSNAWYWVLGIVTSIMANLLTGLALPYFRRYLNIDDE